MGTASAREVVVVGSGPNGLAAAVILARAGLAVTLMEGQSTLGGGARTLPLGDTGLGQDVCATIPAAAPASPFFAEFDLAARGVELLVPEISYAHPLPGGETAVAYRDLPATITELGADGRAWDRLFGPLVSRADEVARIALSDKRSVPVSGWSGMRAGAAFAQAVSVLASSAGDLWWRTDRARALIAGVAAHAITPLPSAGAAGAAAYLATLAHSPTGWPVVRGGIGRIVEALVTDLRAHGGHIITDHHVESPADLIPARVTLLDLHVQDAAALLAQPYADRLSRLAPASGASKVDLVLAGPIPWEHPEVTKAGTVHLGGHLQEIRHAEAEVAAGRHAERPMVLLSEPANLDPGRADGIGRRPVWAYAHVPHGSDVDLTETVLDQIERFAPGVRDLVIETRSTPAARMSEHNRSLPGGDISGGATSLWKMVARPTASRDPYAIAPGVWLCSASTPPGPGIHGMSGWHAARRVLRHLGLPMPSLAPRSVTDQPGQ